MFTVDEIDSKILELLQTKGRIKRSRIAEAVGLSVPSISERMRKLEVNGVVRGYHAAVDAKQLGYDITAFIRVMVDGSVHYSDFVAEATAMPEVQEVHSITGAGSHILKVRARNAGALEGILAQLQAFRGVHGTSTSIVLSTFKETGALPVVHEPSSSNGHA